MINNELRVLGCCEVYATRRRPDARTGRRRVGLEIESVGEIERTVAGETFDDEDEGGHHGQSRVLNLDRLENAEILLGLAGGEAERIEESAARVELIQILERLHLVIAVSEGLGDEHQREVEDGEPE